MQLGKRWDVGATPPARLDAEVLAAIADVESRLAPDAGVGLRWTLTWLEGRPVAELDNGETVTIVRYGWDGLEVVSEA